MNLINIKELKNNIDDNKIIDQGKEVIVYDYGNNVIKIFKNERKSPFKQMSIEGIKKLSSLALKHFNTPTDLIMDGEKLVGYIEKKLQIKDLTEELTIETLDEIKEDIKVLSYNGFKLEDIFYNYTYDTDLIFFDLTSYKYTNTDKKALLDFYYNKNIMLMNTFLVGLTKFDLFKHGEEYELKKLYKANEYINHNIKDEYYGDYFKNTLKY